MDVNQLHASFPHSLCSEAGAVPTVDNKEMQRDEQAASSKTSGLSLELAEIATKIANLDEMAIKVAAAGFGVGKDAKKWHELSVTALDWSRATLVRRQRQCMENLEMLCPKQMPMKASFNGMRSVVSSPPGLQVGDARPGVSGFDVGADADNRPTGTLRAHLEELRSEDPKCILIVRRINRLGFQSPELLGQYFEKFGGARRVLVAHLRVKPSSRRPTPRVRPAGLGFVVMTSGEASDRVMEVQIHMIGDVLVTMEQYRDRRADGFNDDLQDIQEDQ